MRLVSGSLSRHWAMGACLLLLWVAATPTPTQARFIVKRETAHAVDMGVVDAHTADPDIVRASSESASGSTTEATASHVLKNVTEVEFMLGTTTTTTVEVEQQAKREVELELTTTTTTTEAAKPADISTTEAQAAEVKLETKQEPANSDAAEVPISSSSGSGVILHNVTTTEINELLKQSEFSSSSSRGILQNVTTENMLQKLSTAIPNIDTEKQLKAEQQQLTEQATTPTTTTTTTTTTTSTPTTQSLVTTQRGEDHARSMQFPLSTEKGSLLSAVTPMKLRPLPMKTTTTTTTTTTTHMPQLLAPLLHAGVTAAPIASHENAIEEEQPQLHHEKRAKYISDNATNAQQLLLPNGAEVWSLAAMKMVPTTTTTTTTTSTEATTSRSTTELANDIEQLLNRTEQHKEKNLLDWQQIMLMQTSQENRTELTMSTTLDATEAATQATTVKLDALLGGNGEMEMSASSAITASTLNNMATTESRRQVATDEIAITTESLIEAGFAAKPELAATELAKLRAKEIAAAYEAVPISNPAPTEMSKLASKAEAGTAGVIITATSTAKPDLAEPVKLNLTAAAEGEVAATATATAQPELIEPAKLNLTEAAAGEAAAIATATATAQPELTEPAKLNLTAVAAGEADATATATATALPDLTDLNSKAAAIESAITANATKAMPETAATTMPPAALPTAEPETTTTASLSALNGGTPNANEMAMKATAHENNEKSDKSNNVDSDDVINVSVAVSVSTEATLAAITVSTRTAGEASTSTTPTTSTSRTLLDEQLAKTTTTTTTLATPTPTPTEIVQISNEVNLETITVETVTKDKSNKNNVQASGVNNLLITNGEAKNNNSDVNSQTHPINNSDANSAANSQTQPINNSIYSTTTTAATTTTTTTTTPTSLLTDLKANSKLNEQETNNIGETETTAAATTTTTPTPTTSATETTATVRSIATTETAAVVVVNALDESTATTITAATPATAAAKGASDLYEDHDNNKDDDDDVDVDNDDEEHKQQQIEHDSVTEQQLLSKANMANETTTTTTEGLTTTTETTTTTTTTEATTTTTTGAPTTIKTTTTTTEEPFISLLDDSTTTTTTTTTARTTTTEPVYSSTSNTVNNSNTMLPLASSTLSSAHINVDSTTAKPSPTTANPIMVGQPTEVNHMQQPHGNTGTDVNVIIAITVSVIGVVALVLLVAFLYFMRKRQKQTSYGQRCRPVSLDAYSLDNVSVLGSVRRKGRDLRASKRTYGNAAFDDPSLRHNLLSATELAKFVERRSSIYEEFRDVPQISARPDEVPAGCEDKNRFANIIPLPETRVVLQRQADDDKTEYINANYVRGPHDVPNYYIACQAPMESTTGDFWRMIWEQQSRVIVQATDLSEEGIERCAEYLPPSVTLDNHSNYGDFQVTLKHREVKDKYAISTLMLKRVDGAECRELTHYWYKWPEAGVPLEEAPIIAMLLEARSSLKSYALEQANELKHEKSSTLTLKSLEGQTQPATAAAEADKCSTSSAASNEINGNVANKTPRSQQGPLTIHCSPGTGRTGTIIACDMAIRSLETPKRSVDIPQLVYYVRRGRAKAVQTREQYEFIYKVANMYATKITNLSNDN